MTTENDNTMDEGLDESVEVEQHDIVELEDEDGNMHQFALLAIVEDAEQDYAMLAPLEQVQNEEGDELELFLFKYDETEEGGLFSEIEDEETYKRVQAFCSTLVEMGDEE
jgi:hypothetical protein